MLKKISFLLALVFISAVVIGCSDNSGKISDVTTTADTTAVESEINPIDARKTVSDDLPSEDFDGYNFRIFYSGTFGEVNYPEEIVGEVINDAFYERNLAVEERFNIKITGIDSGASAWDIHTSAEKRIVMADEDAFDVTSSHCIGGPNNSIEGLYVNLYDVPHLDFSKPWWQDATVEELTLNEKMFVASNDFTIEGLTSSKVIYFNKAKLVDYNIDEPYTNVFDGTWTLDLLISLTKDIYEDLNGNSERDLGDFYGYSSQAMQNGFLVSCDISVLKKTGDDDLMTLNVNSDKMLTLVEKLYDWYFESSGAMIANKNDPETAEAPWVWYTKIFDSGGSMFAFGTLNLASSNLRASDVEYGILPFPKWNEAQAEYRTFASGNLMAIPVTVRNLERTGIIFEAMSAEGYKQVVPAYYDTALKEKFTFDDDSGKVLDIINGSRAVSFAYVYDNWQGFGHIFSSIFADPPKRDYSSFYAQRENQATARMNAVIEGFR